jgi:hypothetical protein
VAYLMQAPDFVSPRVASLERMSEWRTSLRRYKTTHLALLGILGVSTMYVLIFRGDNVEAQIIVLSLLAARLITMSETLPGAKRRLSFARLRGRAVSTATLMLLGRWLRMILAAQFIGGFVVVAILARILRPNQYKASVEWVFIAFALLLPAIIGSALARLFYLRVASKIQRTDWAPINATGMLRVRPIVRPIVNFWQAEFSQLLTSLSNRLSPPHFTVSAKKVRRETERVILLYLMIPSVFVIALVGAVALYAAPAFPDATLDKKILSGEVVDVPLMLGVLALTLALGTEFLQTMREATFNRGGSGFLQLGVIGSIVVFDSLSSDAGGDLASLVDGWSFTHGSLVRSAVVAGVVVGAVGALLVDLAQGLLSILAWVTQRVDPRDASVLSMDAGRLFGDSGPTAGSIRIGFGPEDDSDAVRFYFPVTLTPPNQLAVAIVRHLEERVGIQPVRTTVTRLSVRDEPEFAETDEPFWFRWEIDMLMEDDAALRNVLVATAAECRRHIPVQWRYLEWPDAWRETAIEMMGVPEGMATFAELTHRRGRTIAAANGRLRLRARSYRGLLLTVRRRIGPGNLDELAAIGG